MPGGRLDAALVAQALVGAPLCLDCIAGKTGLPQDVAKTVLDRIRSVIAISEEEGRCDACLKTVSVFRLDVTGS